MNDTVIYENKESIGTWEQRFQFKSAWKDFLDQGSNPNGLEYYLTVKFRQRQSHDDIKGKINPLLKRFITRTFGFRRLTPNVPMKFIFFIEEGRLNEGFHSHCVFSVPPRWSGFNLDTSDSEFIKRENQVRQNVRSALARFTYLPVNPMVTQIDREMKRRDGKMVSLISNEVDQWESKVEEIKDRPVSFDTLHNWDWDTERLIDEVTNECDLNIKRIKDQYSKLLTEEELKEMERNSNEPKPLISADGFDLRRIYFLNGLLADYQLKEIGKNNDCFDERNSDLSATT